MLTEDATELTYKQVISMCNYLSPGAFTGNQPDYQSAINGLLIATYGSGVTIQNLQANTAPTPGLNTSCQAYAIASDGAGTPPGQGFYDFVQAQVNLSVAVSMMIVSIVNTANQVYACLSNTSNQKYWLSKFTDQAFNQIFTSTLNGTTMLTEVSDTTSSTYLTTVLGPYLMNAPQGICGDLLSIIAGMNANRLIPFTADPSFTLMNQNTPNSYSYALPANSKYVGLNINVLDYGPLGPNSYLTPSFYNGQPGNLVRLQDAGFDLPNLNYLYVDADQGTPGYMGLYGGGSLAEQNYQLEWMVYMPSLNEIYHCFNNPNSNWAMTGQVGPVIIPEGNGTIGGFLIAPYDCTDSYQQFQLQLRDSN